MKAYIEGPGGLPLVKQAQEFRTALPAFFEGNVTITGTLAAGVESVTSELLTVASANALTVGANGVTNPVFNVDSSASSVATGLNVAGAAAASGLALSTLSSGTNENLTVDAKGSGTLTLNGTSTTSGRVFIGNATSHQGVSIQGLVLVTSNNVNSIVVGPNGSTNPTFQVDSSTASAAAGIQIKGTAAAGTPGLATLSSATNESMSISAKGTGTVTINPNVAAAAGGQASSGVMFGSIAVGLFTGTGAPTFSAMNGSIYVDSAATTTTTRIYVNKSGAGTAGTTWTNLTTAA